MRIVDLSGFSFSGKSALSDLLREVDGVYVPPSDVEFDLIRTSGGIISLHNDLVKCWSPVRSSEAIRRFKHLIKIFSGSNFVRDKLFRAGFNYDLQYPGFSIEAEKYINSLVEDQWKGEWPYAYENLNRMQIFVRKLLRKFGFSKATEFDIYHSSPSEEEFITKTREFLNFIICDTIDRSSFHTRVVHNALEPFLCGATSQYFPELKQIVVDRDPRDVYLSAKNYSKGGKKGWNATTGDGVLGFIQKYKSMKKNDLHCSNSDNKLRIYFEDLVLNYDESKSEIFGFLGVDENQHKLAKTFFKPHVSKNGVGMWRYAKGDLKDESDIIAKELKQYCIDL